MQGTNSEYGSPYLAECHFTSLTFFTLKCVTSGIAQIVLMTKVDEACPLVEKDLQSLYVSSYIKSKVRRGHMITWSVATGLRVSEMLFCVCRFRRWALGWVCRCLVCYRWRTTVWSWSWSSTVTSCCSPLYSRCSTSQTTIWMMSVPWRTNPNKVLFIIDWDIYLLISTIRHLKLKDCY